MSHHSALTLNDISFTHDDIPARLIRQLADGIPPLIFATCDVEDFVRRACGSRSLSIAEKIRALDALPSLSQFQIDELCKVWDDESEDFTRLFPLEAETILELSADMLISAFSLAALRGVGISDALESAVICRLVRNKMRRSPGFKRLQGEVFRSGGARASAVRRLFAAYHSRSLRQSSDACTGVTATRMLPLEESVFTF